MSDEKDCLLHNEHLSINGAELVPGMELEDIGVREMTPNMLKELYLEIMGFIL